jgi:CHASE3 domain sensor protein
MAAILIEDHRERREAERIDPLLEEAKQRRREAATQLVQQDEGRRVADQINPILLVRRHRRALVELEEFIGLGRHGLIAPS